MELFFNLKVREDKVKFEKQAQQLTQEKLQLIITIEKLKDHLAEADDRLGNMKLQASVKEVSKLLYPVWNHSRYLWHHHFPP